MPAKGPFTNIPKAHPEIASGILSPQDALVKAIASVVASLPARSAVDDYLIDQLQYYGTKGLVIVHERANGIYNVVDVVSQETKPLDTDNDGIPDAWEDTNGLDKSNASDAVAQASNGCLNIENYIISISAPVTTYVRCASNQRMTTRTKSSIDLSWENHASESDNILVQKSIDGTTRFYTSISFAWENEMRPWAGTATCDLCLGNKCVGDNTRSCLELHHRDLFFHIRIVDIGKDYDEATASTAIPGIVLSSSKNDPLNSGTSDEFLFTGSGTNIMNTGTSL